MTQPAKTVDKSSRRPARGTLRKKAYDAIKESILSGRLKIRERLSESKIMNDFSIGRTPVREALNQLEREGLVKGRPNSGYTVADMDFETVCNLMVVREALDGIAAEFAAELATEDDLKRLQGVMNQIAALSSSKRKRSPESVAEDLELGIKIHLVIADATRNQPLIEMTHRVYDQLRLALWLEVSWIDTFDEAVEEHREIVDAVLARDKKRAAKAARAHIQSSRRNMDILKDIHDRRSLIRGQRFSLANDED